MGPSQRRGSEPPPGRPDTLLLIDGQTRSVALAASRKEERGERRRRQPLPREAVAQVRLGNAARRSRNQASAALGTTTAHEATRIRRTSWPFPEPTLRDDPAGSSRGYATASRGSGRLRRRASDVCGALPRPNPAVCCQITCARHLIAEPSRPAEPPPGKGVPGATGQFDGRIPPLPPPVFSARAGLDCGANTGGTPWKVGSLGTRAR